MPAAPETTTPVRGGRRAQLSSGETSPLAPRSASSNLPQPRPRFLGLNLQQWLLVALGAVLLYLLYLLGAALAWRKGGRRYHLAVITFACLSGARCRSARACCALPDARRAVLVSAERDRPPLVPVLYAHHLGGAREAREHRGGHACAAGAGCLK
jgi:hypothetical protein